MTSDRTETRLLIIEDDPDTAELMAETLRDHFGPRAVHWVAAAADAAECDPDAYDLVLCDINLPDGSGLELLDELLRRRPDLPIVMVTSESGLDVATDAIRRGAADYIVKAGDYLFTVPLIVQKNLEVWRIKQHNVHLEEQLRRMVDELRDKNEQLQDAVQRLETQAQTDPLTGLANRRHISAVLERSFAEAQRYETDLTCVMIDLDRFKQLNDTLGHQTGDRLLQTAARVLEANCRRSDMAGRYGGDEFVLLLPHTDLDTAMTVCRRIQQQFQADIDLLLDMAGGCTMSLGIACARRHRPASADQLVALADAALDRAKAAGKARIEVHPEPPAHPAPSASQPR